ncbi:MAG: glycerophosphodiester phosphodiesterase family protein [Gudongella sp.]|nr:glycerophosphodiester phosphodiesterase family protein [Gudongella sp.]
MFYSIILGIAFLYLYTIYPSKTDNNKIKLFLNRHYAHRGLFNNKNNPENTLSSFKLAIESGYGIEFDVRITKDNIPVVIHDMNLLRVCSADKNISDLYYNELQDLFLFGTSERIPLLKEVLSLINGQVPIIIEIKLDKGSDTTICEIINPFLRNYDGIYAIESFNPSILLWYKKNRPDVIRGQLALNYFKGKRNGFFLNFLLKNLMLNFLTQPNFIAYDYRDRKNLSLWINKKLFNTLLVAYTIKTDKEYEKNKDLFDLFIFESFLLNQEKDFPS